MKTIIRMQTTAQQPAIAAVLRGFSRGHSRQPTFFFSVTKQHQSINVNIHNVDIILYVFYFFIVETEIWHFIDNTILKKGKKKQKNLPKTVFWLQHSKNKLWFSR
jgi:hypothetical protein